jgi:hypothetical protein
MPLSFSYPSISRFEEAEFDSLLEYSSARLHVCTSAYIQTRHTLSRGERVVWETSLKREIVREYQKRKRYNKAN